MGKKQIHLYRTEFYCRQLVREQNTINQMVRLLVNTVNKRLLYKKLVFGEYSRMNS